MRQVSKEAEDPDELLQQELQEEEDNTTAKKANRGRGRGRGRGRKGSGRGGSRGRGRGPSVKNIEPPVEQKEPEVKQKEPEVKEKEPEVKQHRQAKKVKETQPADAEHGTEVVESSASTTKCDEKEPGETPVPKNKRKTLARRNSHSKLRRIKCLSPSSSRKKGKPTPQKADDVVGLETDLVEDDSQEIPQHALDTSMAWQEVPQDSQDQWQDEWQHEWQEFPQDSQDPNSTWQEPDVYEVGQVQEPSSLEKQKKRKRRKATGGKNRKSQKATMEEHKHKDAQSELDDQQDSKPNTPVPNNQSNPPGEAEDEDAEAAQKAEQAEKEKAEKDRQASKHFDIMTMHDTDTYDMHMHACMHLMIMYII